MEMRVVRSKAPACSEGAINENLNQSQLHQFSSRVWTQALWYGLGPGVLQQLMDHGVTQAGKDLRRYLVQPPVQSRVSCEIRPGCSVHSGLEGLQGWKMYNLYEQPASTPVCPHGKKLFLISSWQCSHVNFCLLSHILPPLTNAKSLSPSSQ